MRISEFPFGFPKADKSTRLVFTIAVIGKTSFRALFCPGVTGAMKNYL